MKKTKHVLLERKKTIIYNARHVGVDERVDEARGVPEVHVLVDEPVDQHQLLPARRYRGGVVHDAAHLVTLRVVLRGAHVAGIWSRSQTIKDHAT